MDIEKMLDKINAGKEIDDFSKEKFINRLKKEKLENRYKIIEAILPFLLKKDIELCFKLIYDLGEYEEKTIYLLEDYLKGKSLTKKELHYIINNLTHGKKIILKNLEEENVSYYNLLVIMSYIIEYPETNNDLICFFKNNKNFDVKFRFMNYCSYTVVENFSIIFPNILDDIYYIDKNNNKEYFSMEKLSNIASNISLAAENKENYEKLKNFILKKYPKNNLGKNLLNNNNTAYLKEDLNNLYLTSKDANVEIYKKYEDLLSSEIIGDMQKNYSLFKKTPEHLQRIYTYDLDKNLSSLIDKYLSLSKNKTFKYLAKGTTAACYLVGDYVIKLILGKHYNKEACPSLYLINKAYYEELIKDDFGYCVAGLEIQKYLAKKLNYLDIKALNNYKKLLRDEGYLMRDSIIVPNFRYLDSYLDADCDNLESLPKCFKKKPLVCIDRDAFEKIK